MMDESRAFAVEEEHPKGKGIVVMVKQNENYQTLMGESVKIAQRLI